jgi:enamine deaminase RidA (YjgF/YER057c/UK114 family)
MRKTIFPWLGKEFVHLSGEAKPAQTATEETRELFQRFDEQLRGIGLSLDNCVRSRLWGRDRESRDLGSNERVRILSGKARSASSSYIAPVHFDSNAKVAIDLLAMRPSQMDLQKILKEYEPPITPLRYLVYDYVVILSGVTAVLPTLEEQMADILPRIEGSLRDARSSWEKTAKVSFFLHRSQKFERLKELFRSRVKIPIPEIEYAHVDGYSAEGKFIEIAVTATR